MSTRTIEARRAQTVAARRAQLARFTALADPDGNLSAPDRAAAVDRARSDHYRQLAAKSAAVRRRNAADRAAAVAAALAELAAQRAADAAEHAAALREAGGVA